MSSSSSLCRQTQLVFYVWACGIFMFCPKIFKTTCLQIFFDRYECVGLFMYPMVVGGGVWLRSSSLDVDLTGHEEKAFATESPHWQNTRNLWLPRVPSDSFFR